MINLAPLIERISALLEEDTEQSVTYAALEARLALEKVCYDRLRQRHDYISNADLRGWTPSRVINQIMAEVDPHVRHSITLMMGDNSGVKPEDDSFIEIGTEAGFDPVRISKMWNALAGLALHVRLPENRADHLPGYGDKLAICGKVREVISELQRIAKGTMTFSGIGEEVTFICTCGQENKRRADLLKAGQSISCFNQNCNRSYKVHMGSKGSFFFSLEAAEIPCAACDVITLLPERALSKMTYNQRRLVKCLSCGHTNVITLLLYRADLATTKKTTDTQL